MARLNLMELYYGLLLRGLKKEAEMWYTTLLEYTVEIPDSMIKAAMEFRLQNKNLNLSYVDCIGYIISLGKNIKFLTGDRQFKNMSNVEFVK